MASSRIEDLVKSARDLNEPIRVSGGNLSAYSLCAARWLSSSVKSAHHQGLIIAPSAELALLLAEDCRFFLGLLGVEIAVLEFPTWEQSPYSPISPSIRTRLSRLSTLSALHHEAPASRLIVTTIEAAAQATLPPVKFLQSAITLIAEESIKSREALAERLGAIGYQRVDTVEDPGTFAIRGEIIDLYPLDRKQPIRIELFDDLIERMREFDPSSQRASTPLKRCQVFPAREVLIHGEASKTLRERIKLFSDENGISRSVRDPLLESIQNGIYPEQADAWAPFAYENSATLWDHLPESTSVFWYDELGCDQNWDQFIAKQKEFGPERIIPSPEALFPWNSERHSLARSKTRFYFDRLELASLEEKTEEPENQETSPRLTDQHRISIKGNSDLMNQSKPTSKTSAQNTLDSLQDRFALWDRQGFEVHVLASTQSQVDRIRFLLQERDMLSARISVSQGHLNEGFRWPAEGQVFITENEIFGSKRARKNQSATKDWIGLQALSDLAPGDRVVHRDHGIGLYQGLVRLNLSGAASDFLLLEYAGKDKLYVPVYRMNVIQKYSGGETAALDRLGTQQFAKAKEKAKDSINKLAIDLVRLYAEREIRPGTRFSPPDSLFSEFEGKFPFDETPDQLKAIQNVMEDLESGKAMDRLVCGDVGYGKTEVAIRAAFRAVTEGKQVAVLVPTTILAYQHELSFKSRLKDYPMAVESVSRFKSPKEQKAVIDALAAGKIDIVIGTHRLLSKDVRFKDLGLIVIDEEHRFGVEHKERLKTLKVDTHVLTLSATPIPRTLHMALSGLRDISLIHTPPVDRLPIRTFVSKLDDDLIRKSIEFELQRGGQVFYLHNRVQTIYERANHLKELIPNAQLSVAHGQMPETELEKAMLEFYERRSQILICTSIIESGLDLPLANTLIVERADALGLAQLYQIRGRVGRGDRRAYAYLMIPSEGAITEDAKKRLEVIQKFVELGSGFSIASHDLDLRGGGDLLGAQQSGHIAAVGFDLYTELLEEAIAELRTEESTPKLKEPEIQIPWPAFLSEDYVPDIHQRLSLYRRLSGATDQAELTSLEEELQDRFGKLPEEAMNLLVLIRLKQLLKAVGIESMNVGKEKISLLIGDLQAVAASGTPSSHRLDPVKVVALVTGQPRQYQLTPDSKLVIQFLPSDSSSPSTRHISDLHLQLESLFKKISLADSLKEI